MFERDDYTCTNSDAVSFSQAALGGKVSDHEHSDVKPLFWFWEFATGLQIPAGVQYHHRI